MSNFNRDNITDEDAFLILSNMSDSVNNFIQPMLTVSEDTQRYVLTRLSVDMLGVLLILLEDVKVDDYMILGNFRNLIYGEIHDKTTRNKEN